MALTSVFGTAGAHVSPSFPSHFLPFSLLTFCAGFSNNFSILSFSSPYSSSLLFIRIHPLDLFPTRGHFLSFGHHFFRSAFVRIGCAKTSIFALFCLFKFNLCLVTFFFRYLPKIFCFCPHRALVHVKMFLFRREQSSEPYADFTRRFFCRRHANCSFSRKENMKSLLRPFKFWVSIEAYELVNLVLLFYFDS